MRLYIINVTKMLCLLSWVSVLALLWLIVLGVVEPSKLPVMILVVFALFGTVTGSMNSQATRRGVR